MNIKIPNSSIMGQAPNAAPTPPGQAWGRQKFVASLDAID